MSSPLDRIEAAAAPFMWLPANEALREAEPECPVCGGDGWYIDHEDECYETGDCNCSGVQVECECQSHAALRAVREGR